eukprot:254611_1
MSFRHSFRWFSKAFPKRGFSRGIFRGFKNPLRATLCGVVIGAFSSSRFVSVAWAESKTAPSLGLAENHIGETLPRDRTTELSELIQAHRVEHGIPGVSVVIMQGGKLIFERGFGFSDVENLVKCSPEARMRIGSVSKTITGIGLGILIDRGLIDLDTPIREYLPDLPPDKGHLTCRQLASHHGGVRHYAGDEFRTHKTCTNVSEALDVFINDDLTGCLTPGNEGEPCKEYTFCYSTYGVVLLSAVMEAVCGNDFCSFIVSEVLKPLGMFSTHSENQRRLLPHRSRGYAHAKKSSRLINCEYADVSCKWAGGGYISTVGDMALMGHNILLSLSDRQAGLVRPETMQMMCTPHGGSDDHIYGLLMQVTRDETVSPDEIYGHSGQAIGSSSFLMIVPSEGLSVAILCNVQESSFVYELACKIAASARGEHQY